MGDRGERHRVVVVGGGFGGLQAVRSLRDTPVEVTLIDRRNFHLFQPLLYQVATGALAPEEIAAPLRGVLGRQRNVRVVMCEVRAFDLDARRVIVDRPEEDEQHLTFAYDTLIVAGGSRYSYFGHDEWRAYAHEIKSLESATAVRQRIFGAFEAAELEQDPERRDAWLTFVVVGGGPTGVEMAGQIAELARHTSPRGFRSADPRRARILLVEASERLLPTFPPRLSTTAARALEKLGVTPLLHTAVIDLDQQSVSARRPDGETERIPTHTIVWSAGVVASELAGALAASSGAELDRGGRVAVGPQLTIEGYPDVIALGDMVSVHDAAGNDAALPGLASTAMQQGRYAASAVRARLRGRAPGPFRYVDKGDLATIGRASAVADIKGIQISGMLAWLTWLAVHIFYLIGLQNRLLVLTRWAFSFLTRGRSARLITHSPSSSSLSSTAARFRKNGGSSDAGGALDDRRSAGVPPPVPAAIGTGGNRVPEPRR
jgi:NADH dehydrogenase